MELLAIYPTPKLPVDSSRRGLCWLSPSLLIITGTKNPRRVRRLKDLQDSIYFLNKYYNATLQQPLLSVISSTGRAKVWDHCVSCHFQLALEVCSVIKPEFFQDLNLILEREPCSISLVWVKTALGVQRVWISNFWGLFLSDLFNLKHIPLVFPPQKKRSNRMRSTEILNRFQVTVCPKSVGLK